MKTFKLLTVAISLLLFISSCKSGGNLDEGTAEDVISAHLKANPEYESTKINIGEIKFRSKNDKLELQKYKALEEKGLVDMELQNQKKKFLSKDSVYFYLITLTDKAKPYILKHDAHNATVRALNYVLDEEKPITLIKGDSKIARVTVSLKKELTDFSIFLRTKTLAATSLLKLIS
ncbi:hypothetical protein [Pedobacter steynii]